MNNVSSANCFNGENSTIWILILILLFCSGSCGFNFGGCGSESLIIIIFILFFFNGKNGLF